MKSIILMTLIISLFSLSTLAQTMRSPGGADEPPSAAEDKQDDLRHPNTHFGRESANAYELAPKDKKNPMHERGPVGKQAQEAAKKDDFEIEKEEIEHKQKGE